MSRTLCDLRMRHRPRSVLIEQTVPNLRCRRVDRGEGCDRREHAAQECREHEDPRPSGQAVPRAENERRVSWLASCDCERPPGAAEVRRLRAALRRADASRDPSPRPGESTQADREECLALTRVTAPCPPLCQLHPSAGGTDRRGRPQRRGSRRRWLIRCGLGSCSGSGSESRVQAISPSSLTRRSAS